jgi:prephenate dehydrogenase
VSPGSSIHGVAIVGVGLIGGSFALALRKAGFSGRIIGVSSSRTVQKALELGVIDAALSLAEAAAHADLIYLAQPIQQILDSLDALDALLRPGTLITDAGSTKSAICTKAAAAVRRGRFIGGHPMAGKETRGVEGADADLFRGRPYILTAHDPELEHWISRIGAGLVFLDPEEHDRLVAAASHLPQMASIALASLIAEQAAECVAGPGAQDMTRLALSSYEIWRDILATNAGPIEAALSAFIAKLESLRADLRKPEMAEEFTRAAAAAQSIRNRTP